MRVTLEFARQGGSFIYIDNANGEGVPKILEKYQDVETPRRPRDR